MSARLHGVHAALVNGLSEKGEGGVLWVKGKSCTYCFPSDFPNGDFAEGIRSTLAHDEAKRFFFVVNEEGGKAHVIAYEREAVFRSAREAAAAAEPVAEPAMSEGKREGE